MNVAIDDGYAYDLQQLPFKQIAFQMDTDDHGNLGNILGGEAASEEAVAELNRKVDNAI